MVQGFNDEQFRELLRLLESLYKQGTSQSFKTMTAILIIMGVGSPWFQLSPRQNSALEKLKTFLLPHKRIIHLILTRMRRGDATQTSEAMERARQVVTNLFSDTGVPPHLVNPSNSEGVQVLDGVPSPEPEQPQNLDGVPSPEPEQPPTYPASGPKLCTTRGCANQARTGGKCSKHGGGKRCKHPGCTNGAITGGDGAQNMCKLHGGGYRCCELGCKNSARPRTLTDGLRYCIKHGGGKKCAVVGCKSTGAGQDHCKKHGGSTWCSKVGCLNKANGFTDRCRKHKPHV